MFMVFENGANQECDSIIGAAPYKELTELYRDHKYLNANIWGKCAYGEYGEHILSLIHI